MRMGREEGVSLLSNMGGNIIRIQKPEFFFTIPPERNKEAGDEP